MKINAELKVREMSAKARAYYSGLGQGKLTYDTDTNVYYWDDQCGTGEQEMTFEQVQAMFEGLHDENKSTDDYNHCETVDGELDMEMCRKLCEDAGMLDEFESADGETFESVIYLAAEKLGVDLFN